VTRVLLGAEHDAALLAALRAVLSEAGAVPEGEGEEEMTLAGSQERVVQRFRVGGETVTAEAETYAGLSLRGPEDVVRRIADEVRARRAGGPDGVA
jgi:hypothetical protein